MWQDWLIASVQAFFCINLLPAIRKDAGKATPLFTSISTALGMVLIAGATATIPLYFSALTSSIVALEWLMLARQKWRQPRAS